MDLKEHIDYFSQKKINDKFLIVLYKEDVVEDDGMFIPDDLISKSKKDEGYIVGSSDESELGKFIKMSKYFTEIEVEGMTYALENRDNLIFTDK